MARTKSGTSGHHNGTATHSQLQSMTPVVFIVANTANDNTDAAMVVFLIVFSMFMRVAHFAHRGLAFSFLACNQTKEYLQ
jgi:hypothetical protein